MTPQTAARILQLHEELDHVGRCEQFQRQSANQLSMELEAAIRDGLREMVVDDARRVAYAHGMPADDSPERNAVWLLCLGAAVTAAYRGLIDFHEVDEFREYMQGVMDGKLIEPPAHEGLPAPTTFTLQLPLRQMEA